MADLFTVTAPLSLRRADGRKAVLVAVFPHEDGLIGCEPFWHEAPESRIHVLPGPIKGDGPWKVGDCVVNVLGCQGTDPELAGIFNEWQMFMQQGAPGYPSASQLQEFIRREYQTI